MKNRLIQYAMLIGIVAGMITLGQVIPASSQSTSFTAIPWTAISPNPCPAASPLSIAVAPPGLYVICSDKKIYYTQKQ
jgi:hypothetical protein